MAFDYEGVIILHDEQGLRTTLTYDFGIVAGTAETSAGTAWASLNAIAAELVTITTANILDLSIRGHDDTLVDGSLPGEAEIAEEAALSVHLVASPAPEKLGTIRVPAPIDALFLADGVTVNTTNADLQAYVEMLADYTYMSDGEAIVDARGAGGMKAGWLRFRARSGKAK